MIELEFHDLFRPSIGELSKKASERQTKAVLKPRHQRKQSMSREMREIANGILRQMLDKNNSRSAVGSLIASQSNPNPNESPFIELSPNASEFTVFSAIRQSVLQKQLKNSSLVFNSTFGRISNTDNESEDELNDNKLKDSVMKVPKVVGLGLSVAFELIRESRSCLPSLCIRALQALLNALQGQLPEGLKNEPSDVINPLFDLLLELASSQPTYQESTEAKASTSTSVSNNQTFVELKSYACSALLSLVTARGDTGKTLTAITALLTSPQLTADNDSIETPNILISLQRSVHCVLLGKTKRPDWVTHGFCVNSLCDTFNVQIPSEMSKHFKQSSLAFDGKYLYLYSGNQIHKIGSGYCGTVKGQLVHSNSIGSHKTQSGLIGWIGYVGDSLYLQTNNWTHNELIRLDKNSLKEVGKVTLGVSQLNPSACASDNDSLILITATKDDCFVIRTLKPSIASKNCSTDPNNSSMHLMSVTQELTIKLSHKCLNVCGGVGSAIFEQPVPPNEPQSSKQSLLRAIDTIEADDIVQICCGKDFALIRTFSGKVFYTGKAQSLGIKQSGQTFGKWSELPITKSPKIEHISVGHDGSHALLVSEDGSVFFVGLAKRGEDGEQTKSRRQPKAGKPKKMIKMEGKCVEFCACNHGSSAVVTKNGELYLFGKDAHHVDRNTGLVNSLRHVVISQVAIGKAHILALSNKGHVYTFGISNKGQCGLDLMQTSSGKDVNNEDIEERNIEQQIDVTEDITEPLCSLGQHRWKYDQCMICTICGECTGYGTGCIASGKSERNPGMSCGCGAGDAGCADCGCCRACEAIPKETFAANENNEPSLMPLNQMAFNAAQQLNYADPLNDEMQRFAAAFAMVDSGINGAIASNEHVYEEPAFSRASLRGELIGRLNPRTERRRIGIDVLGRRLRHASKAYRNLVSAGGAGRSVQMPIGENGPPQHLEIIDKAVSNVINIDLSDGAGSDGETSKLTQLPPTKLNIPSRIIQIACGLHHSVLLTSSGDVFTFGSNQFGQLGHNDFAIREVPTKLLINATIIQIAAGSNHTVLLSSTGQVYTFGSNQKGQLGRNPSAIDFAWNAVAVSIPNIGQQFGRKATFISASGDHTFIKFDESLINPLSLSSARVIANRRCIAIIPSNSEISAKECRYESMERQFHSLVISRSDGSCKTFNSCDQLELSNYSAVCLDNYYDVLWTYDSKSHSFNRYNLIYAETKIPNQSVLLTSILLPELALPQKPSTHVNRTTAALNLLCTLDTLTAAHQMGWTIEEVDQSKSQITKSLSKDDYSSVCRFESHGGGWGFSSHSIEAIRFMADNDVLLGGFGLFGGRGEYTAKLKLFDIGPDGGEQEGDGDILAETDEIPFECAARQKYPILFEEPIHIHANRWYVAWARISGPSSDCGSSGQSVVNTEDQVIFYFKSSKKSNNGTDVNAGQIPQLLYKVTSNGTDTSSHVSNRNEYNCLFEEPVCIIGKEFSLTVSADCFQSLLKLLRWGWKSFKAILSDINSGNIGSGNVLSTNLTELRHLTYICCSSLHLLKVYINEIYPNRHNESKPLAQTNDSLRLAECIYDVRTLLKYILSDPPESPPRNHSFTGEVNAFLSQILDESHETFLSCYHSFFPSSSLRWRALCDLLLSDNHLPSRSVYLLSAMLAALCRPWVRLTQTFPIMNGLDVYNLQSPSDLQSPNSDLGSYQHSILNDKILEKTDEEGCHSGTECSFRDIFNNLLKIIGQPIRYALEQENSASTSELEVENEFESENSHSIQLVENSCNLITTIMSELVAQVTGVGYDSTVMSGQQLHITPSRFSRISQNRTWNTGNGSPDAICFSVDRSGISIAGVTVYGGIGNEWHYELELLDYGAGAQPEDRSVPRDGQSHPWRTVELAKGSYNFEDKTSDVCEIKFERPVLIAPNVKYALRLKNHGPRTNNGDAGLTAIRGPDNTTFAFSDCSLSFNGTNHTRGQIPQILYYSSPQSYSCESNHYPMNEEIPRKNAIAITESVMSLAIDLLVRAQDCASFDLIWKISSSHVIKKLLPLILAHLAPIASTDSKNATQILSMIRQLLPLVVYLNKSNDYSAPIRSISPLPPPSPTITTSRHYVTVESDHPYKSATVCNYSVKFPMTVKWMCIDFDTRCATAQPEDTLQIYIPELRPPKCWESSKVNKIQDNNKTFWPILKKFNGKPNTWPTNSVVIPGNELILSLETASDYVKEDKTLYYGFRAQVIGYENPITEGLYLGLQYLEQELTYLSGICIKTLLKKNLVLPQMMSESDVNYELAFQTFETHSNLLSRGLALSHPMSASEAIDGVVPLANEHPFLKDFCSLTPGTSGARLAKWFQSESFVDPNQCEVHCSGGTDGTELQCGWPTVITVITRDQYSNMVNVPNLKVEVSAQPFKNNSDTSSKPTNGENCSSDVPALPTPVQNVQYSITAKDKVFYHAITMMRQFENYSFEELRYVTPVKRPTIETMLVRSNNDGTYTANWTPGSTGWYQLKITVDGVAVNTTQSVQVGEPPIGVSLPQIQNLSYKSNKRALPSRTRKFVVRNSSGLRVRSLPSLQSEQMGVIEVNGVITITEESHNDDGVWVRLSPDSIKKYCNNTLTTQQHIEGWALQYNQHLGKTLLVPIGEPKPIIMNNGPTSEAIHDRKLSTESKALRKKTPKDLKKRLDFPGLYHVVKCGVSGHNIRSKPHLRAPPVGMIVLGNVIGVVVDCTNSSGTWLRLDEESMKRYCFSTDGEGWTLARTQSDVIYLQHEMEVMHITDEEDNENKVFQYSNHRSVSKHNGLSTNPFIGLAQEDRSSATNSNVCALSQSLYLDKSLSSMRDQTSISQSFASESEVESIAPDSVMASPSLFGNTFAELERTEIDSSFDSMTNSNSSLTTTGSRVAALQKKLLTDSEFKASIVRKNSASESPGREPPPELHGISVKELVKAMSCDQNITPPTTPPPKRTPVSSRSSSPNISIGSTRRNTTTAIPVRPSLNTSLNETNCNNEGINRKEMKDRIERSIDIPVKSCAQKATQTSPPEESLLIPPQFLHFKINNSGQSSGAGARPTPHPVSPTASRNIKELRNGRQNRLKRERPLSPTHSMSPSFAQNAPNGRLLTVKEAISNSVAECIRAVFAAFIWHEGILHDTLAAASYLKFNPEVTKETVKSLESDYYSDSVKLRPNNRCESRSATREQKAKFRHSVEVSQLSSFQQNECLLNANIEPNKMISETDLSQTPETNMFSEPNSAEQLMSQSEESATDKLMIPETLVNLLKLWQIVSKCCLNAIVEPPSVLTPPNLTAPSTPVQMFNRIQNNQRIVQMVSEEINKSRNKSKQQYNEFGNTFVPKAYPPVHRFFGAVAQHGNLFGEAALANGGPHYEGRESSHSSLCELCGNSYSYPVTHHMRKSHPGCGEHAGGKGYNSSGSFCGGWAGHCGDGGIGSSNWYLICDKCRDKYLAQKRHNRGQNSVKGKHSTPELKALPLSPPNKTNISSPTTQLEIHQLMKDNAMFLLRMAPANDVSPVTNSFNPNRIRQSLEFAVQGSSFQCLENLGIHHSIYDQRLAEEHLSEDDIIAIQTDRPSNLMPNNEQLNANESLEKASKAEQKTIASRSHFHRSVSVGLHDWSTERHVSATPRKRAISNDNSSTTFLCQPSANLINLVQTCVKDNHPFSAQLPTTSYNTETIRPMVTSLVHRPIMAFILHPHDLFGLMIAMKSALRKSSCRTLALQALNWLLRNVSQPMALHDLMWFFVDSLTPNEPKERLKENANEENAVNGVVSANAINAANNARSPVDRRDEIEVNYHNQTDVCQHPLVDLTIAGEAAQPLTLAFHTFLSTVSDLMPLLPMGSPLQQIAVRCFCINFSVEDHSFLHQCHVFSNISKIFGRTEDETNGADDTQPMLFAHPVIEAFQDLTPQMDIKASSRQAMIASLTDNSTETFWESGDEDRNKTKVITINTNNDVKDLILKSIYIHIDNVRDLGSKTSNVSFKFGDSNALEPQLTKLKVSEVDNRFAGWLYCVIPYVESSLKCIKLELKGPDNTLRLRQIKILGSSAAKSQDKPKPYISSIQIQQTNCETETLRVFRLLTSQVFGKLISGEADSESVCKSDISNVQSEQPAESAGSSGAANDLREHMVGILFSQSGKLTHLQKQVCAHIVSAIRVEAVRQREEWEALLCSKSLVTAMSGEIPSDAYCFEMLSMVLALSGSTVGRQYLALQEDLLLDLFNLLHTGSARVQRQVIALLRRVLPEIKPIVFSQMFGIPSLPPRDIIVSNDKEELDIHSVGVLDVFLACIAKSLTVQTKVKGLVGGTSSKTVTTVTLATAIHPRDPLGDRWWLRGCLSRKLSECIIGLLKDMSAGKLSDSWAVVTKNAIAQNILNLTRINQRYRAPAECIKTPTLWIALASLCVLEQEHAERLSSSHWVNAGDQENGNQQLRPLCDNHDDRETPAIILCTDCGNLCAECDRYLHLHSKTRAHQRQIFKEEEEAIRVDLHEGCGRTKLFWLMALADSKTLKAMVEFKGESTRSKMVSALSGQKSVATNITGVCRFCGQTGNTGLLAIGNVCSEAECQEYAKNACNKTLGCGHQCGGIANEWKCLPCLSGCSGQLKQDGDDMCMICFSEALSCAPAIQLKCGHVFHQHCTKAVLQNRWAGPRITFSFSLCPICKSPIEQTSLEEILVPIRSLYDDVRRKALMRLEYEGLHRCEAITVSGGRFYNDATNYAMERYAYYVCSKCTKAYYGGEARCDAELGVGDNYDPSELVCGGCSDVSRAQMCPKHGTDFLEYKCRYCCTVAVFFCFGTTHFCNACHDDFQKLTNLREFPKCPAGPRGKQLDGDECPLHVKHPPTGEEFALGCGVCRNAHTF